MIAGATTTSMRLMLSPLIVPRVHNSSAVMLVSVGSQVRDVDSCVDREIIYCLFVLG